MERTKPKEGDRLYVVNSYYKSAKEYEVSQVGTKYFYFKGLSRARFSNDGWHHDSKTSTQYDVYANKEEHDLEVWRRSACSKIFQRVCSVSNLAKTLTDDELRQLLVILKIEVNQ